MLENLNELFGFINIFKLDGGELGFSDLRKISNVGRSSGSAQLNGDNLCFSVGFNFLLNFFNSGSLLQVLEENEILIKNLGIQLFFQFLVLLVHSSLFGNTSDGLSFQGLFTLLEIEGKEFLVVRILRSFAAIFTVILVQEILSFTL